MKIKIGVITVLTMLAVDWWILRLRAKSSEGDVSQLPSYSSETLLTFNGNDPSKPVLLAMDGYVYDVSAGAADFYGPGQPYHDLAGKDASSQLHLFGGDIVKRKYSIVGVYKP